MGTLAHTAAAFESKCVTAASKITINGLKISGIGGISGIGSVSGITGSRGSLPTDDVLDSIRKDLVASFTPRDDTPSLTPAKVSRWYGGNITATVVLAATPGLNFVGFVDNEHPVPGTLDKNHVTCPGTYKGKDAGAPRSRVTRGGRPGRWRPAKAVCLWRRTAASQMRSTTAARSTAGQLWRSPGVRIGSAC